MPESRAYTRVAAGKCEREGVRGAAYVEREDVGMRQRVFGVAIVGMFAAMLAGVPVQAGAVSQSIPLHSSGIQLAGTVNVASLPSATGFSVASGVARQLPLRGNPGNGSAGPAGPAWSASADGIQAPLLSAKPGRQLTKALTSADNPVALTPPDMAVGADKTHVVEMVNIVGRIWTSAVPGSTFQLNSFFLAGTDFISDPWVLFDQESGHWFAGIFDVTLGGEQMAASKTGDPTGSWFVYAVQYPGQPGGGCPDQGKGGVDNNVVTLGFNEFAGNGCTGGFLGGAVEIFNKTQMMAGASLNFVYTSPQPSWISMVPAQALSSGQTTAYFASNDLNSTSKMLHRVTSTGVPGLSTVTLTALADLTLAHTYPAPPKAKQPGTSTTLASGDQRMQHVVWKAGVGLLMSWTEACKPALDTAIRDCGRVIATNDGVGGPAVIMDKELSKKGQYYVYPAVTLNSANDVVATFGVTSTAIFPQLDAAVATVGGTFGPSLVLVKSTASNLTTRYGDYFAVALDPGGTTPNQNVWAAGEVGGGPGSFDWQTGVREVNVTP
jgi:hypothetical protein